MSEIFTEMSSALNDLFIKRARNKFPKMLPCFPVKHDFSKKLGNVIFVPFSPNFMQKSKRTNEWSMVGIKMAQCKS